jgi:glycosyltransferase involved in cell wall biosynthesis
MTPLVSIIVPAYNEAVRLRRSLRTILEYLNRYGNSELILVDDGSTDHTTAVAEQSLRHSGSVSTRLISYSKNRGKGYAVRTGLLAARAPIALFTDADLSTPITEVPKLVDPIARGDCDFAFGSRALDRSLIGVHQPWTREMGGRVFNLVVRLATGLPFWDTQCGFKAFRMSVCRPLAAAATVERFGFDVELLYIAHRAGLRLREIPVRWDHCDGSKVCVQRDAARMIGEIQTVRRQAAVGLYDRAMGEACATALHEQASRFEVALAG